MLVQVYTCIHTGDHMNSREFINKWLDVPTELHEIGNLDKPEVVVNHNLTGQTFVVIDIKYTGDNKVVIEVL